MRPNFSCDKFLYSFKGAPTARQRRAGSPDASRDAKHRARMRDGDGAPPPRPRRGNGGPTGRLQGRRPCRALSGGSPDGRAAAARSAGPHPQVGGACRHVAPMARLQRPDLARPPCRASSRRARSQSRALPLVASPRRWAQAPTLECDLPRQDLGTYRKDGADRGGCRTTSHAALSNQTFGKYRPLSDRPIWIYGHIPGAD